MLWESPKHFIKQFKRSICELCFEIGRRQSVIAEPLRILAGGDEQPEFSQSSIDLAVLKLRIGPFVSV